jgi:hypothetical protein
MSKLSVSNWRSSRHLDAPSASRTAISCWRTSARDSSRFARFAHAMASTNATISMAGATICALVASKGIADSFGITRTPTMRVRSSRDPGGTGGSANRPESSASACWRETPGRRRAFA